MSSALHIVTVEIADTVQSADAIQSNAPIRYYFYKDHTAVPLRLEQIDPRAQMVVVCDARTGQNHFISRWSYQPEMQGHVRVAAIPEDRAITIRYVEGKADAMDVEFQLYRHGVCSREAQLVLQQHLKLQPRPFPKECLSRHGAQPL